MTRSDLVARLAERFPQLTQRDTEFAVKTILDAMSDALANGLFFPGVEYVAPYIYSEGLSTLFDYLPEAVRLWVDDPAQVESAWDTAWQSALDHARQAEEARRAARQDAFCVQALRRQHLID